MKGMTLADCEGLAVLSSGLDDNRALRVESHLERGVTVLVAVSKI